jgi:hypothetical protein
MLRLVRSRCAKWIGTMTLSFSVAMLAFSVSGMGAMHTVADSLDAKVSVAASGDPPKAPPCDQCGGDHEMSAAACSALCASSLAVLPSPAMLPVLAVVRTGASPPAQFPASHNDPPDPYPPRPAIPS